MSLRRLECTAIAHSAAPPDQVWATFADVASWPTFSDVVASIEAAPASWTVGARVAFTLRVGGARVPFDVRVDACEPPHLVRWSSVRWSVTGTRTHAFVAEDGGTRVTDQKVFTHPFWPMAIAYPWPVIDRMSRAWVAALAREAERRAATASPR